MADTGTAPAPMTAEDRASEVTFNWALQMPGHELPFCTDLYDDLKGRMAAAIRAAEQEAYERGKGIGRAEVVEEMIKQGLISRETVDAIRARNAQQGPA